MSRYDIAIVGAGIAGASLAAALAPHARVLLLEAEEHPGYHATGRSAAFWSETYGGPGIQPLTTASGAALAPYLDPLGSLHIARAGEADALEAFLAGFDGTGVVLERCDPAARVPGLRPEWALGAFEPSCAYIDVGALHGDFLTRARREGVELRTSAALTGLSRRPGGWMLETRAGTFVADLLVDAAGAWADDVAQMAGVARVGLQPYRRTMLQLATEPAAPAGLPHVVHVGGSFYFKPEAGGRLWLSPHDETPSPPSDVQPEEIDVALAIDRFEHVVDWEVTALERKWAGLRTFAPDRLPVYGRDSRDGGFFWFAGQGGFGIQTSPAAAALAAALVLGRSPDATASGLDPERYAPGRFLRG
jgi:D-arginine dehydrogenase